MILLLILIIIVLRGKSKSGTYTTREESSPRTIADGMPVAMALDDGGFHNVQTIDLDVKEERYA